MTAQVKKKKKKEFLGSPEMLWCPHGIISQKRLRTTTMNIQHPQRQVKDRLVVSMTTLKSRQSYYNSWLCFHCLTLGNIVPSSKVQVHIGFIAGEVTPRGIWTVTGCLLFFYYTSPMEIAKSGGNIKVAEVKLRSHFPFISSKLAETFPLHTFCWQQSLHWNSEWWRLVNMNSAWVKCAFSHDNIKFCACNLTEHTAVFIEERQHTSSRTDAN